MSEITASMVKELREKTGAGMMACKKALTEANGDMEASVDWLRKKGLSAAAKKADRVAAEGLIAMAGGDKKAVVVEVNAETDFVALNEKFQAFSLDAAKIALTINDDIETLKNTAYPAGGTVQEALTNLVATVGENMSLRRMKSLSVNDGVVAAYMHNAQAANLGKIGVLVALESTADKAKLMELGKKIAMHIAATRPEALSIADLDPKTLEREKNVLADQARASGKPEEIIEKMVEGRLRKFYEEAVLLEQVFVVDGETKIAKVIENAATELGAPVTLTGFIRYQLGEGIEKATDDFAAEVAKIAGN